MSSAVDRLLRRAQESDDAEEARRLLEEAAGLAPDDPDVHHELGLVCEELDDREAMIAAFLTVLRFDPVEDRARNLLDDAARERIAEHAESALERLPEQFTERLGNVAIVIEDYPSADLVAQGFDPRAFGLFEGPDDLAQHIDSALLLAPTRIVLFAANLLAAFPDPNELGEEVAVTVLHEIGHYFGLDEEQVAALGLA